MISHDLVDEAGKVISDMEAKAIQNGYKPFAIQMPAPLWVELMYANLKYCGSSSIPTIPWANEKLGEYMGYPVFPMNAGGIAMRFRR
jgi:hypothetical protein